jgi:putative hydrolase of the HAD superfamily
MNAIKNIILDLGGVLINLDFNNLNVELGKIGLSNIFTKSQQIQLFDEYEEGKLSSRQFLNELNKLAKINCNNEKLIKAWNSILLDFPANRLSLLKYLNTKYRMFLFSNTNSIHIQEVYARLKRAHGVENLDSYFEKVYLSNELGIRKPKPEGFKHIVNSNELRQNETLFIDDSPQHLVGAKSIGIHTEWLNLQKEDLHEMLSRLLLI